jgi:hypothetical protein
MTGAIVLATEQGLGYLAKDFYDNGVIDTVFVWRHSTRKNHYEWYPNRVNSIDELLATCDTLVFFETPFDWSVIKKARERGIKTILMPMYECTQTPLPYYPDLILCPSKLDLDYYKEGREVVVPVSVRWKKRDTARVFVHNAGNGGLGGRNGTKELLEAMKYVKSPIKLIVRSQTPIKEYNDPRIEYRTGTFEDIWSEGDVFVFPEKFNGLSLPLQEAFASGMLVMCGKRYPMTEWLPNEPMIPVLRYTKESIARQFECAHYDPVIIAKTIDAWYNKDISEYSLLGKEFNKNNNWSIWREKYKTLLSQ